LKKPISLTTGSIAVRIAVLLSIPCRIASNTKSIRVLVSASLSASSHQIPEPRIVMFRITLDRQSDHKVFVKIEGHTRRNPNFFSCQFPKYLGLYIDVSNQKAKKKKIRLKGLLLESEENGCQGDP
jgi:hypothetical protein